MFVVFFVVNIVKQISSICKLSSGHGHLKLFTKSIHPCFTTDWIDGSTVQSQGNIQKHSLSIVLGRRCIQEKYIPACISPYLGQIRCVVDNKGMYSLQFSKNFPLPKNGGHFEFSNFCQKWQNTNLLLSP